MPMGPRAVFAIVCACLHILLPCADSAEWVDDATNLDVGNVGLQIAGKAGDTWSDFKLRGTAGYAAVVVAAIELAIKIADMVNEDHERRDSFALDWVGAVQDKYPDYRFVAVVLNSNSVEHSVTGDFHPEPVEKELDLNFGWYKYRLYMIHVTGQGELRLKGDAGPKNWAYSYRSNPDFPSKLAVRTDTNEDYGVFFPPLFYEVTVNDFHCGPQRLSGDNDAITYALCATSSCATGDFYGNGVFTNCGPCEHQVEGAHCDRRYSWNCFFDLPPAEPGGKCGLMRENDYTSAVRCDGQCCSKYGYCGLTKDHCLKDAGCNPYWGWCLSEAELSEAHSIMGFEPTATSLPTAGPGGACGSGTAVCGSDQCCSQYGWCGVTDGHCGDGCQEGYGKCN